MLIMVKRRNVSLKDYTKQNKKAREFDAYNFWIEQSGKPENRAKRDIENPKGISGEFTLIEKKWIN